MSGENSPWRITIDSDYVFYIAHDAGRIMRLPKTGGTAVTLVSGLHNPWDIAVDLDYVYFTERDGPGGWHDPNGHVKRVPKSGGDVEVLADGHHPHGIAIDSEHIYFSERDMGNIKRISLGGGDIETIASGLNIGLAGIAVDSGYVYFAENNVAEPENGRVGKVPKDGGDIMILAAGQHNPTFVVTDSNNVYFAEEGAGNVRRVSKSGGIVEMLSSGFNRPMGIAVSSGYVYFSDYDGVYRLPLIIEATVDMNPDTLNLKSNGEWITCYIELSAGYNVGDIDTNTILLNGTIGVDLVAPTQIGDHDFDDIADLMVKFDRSTVIDWLRLADYSQDTGKCFEVNLKITGIVAGTQFEGTDTVRVLLRG